MLEELQKYETLGSKNEFLFLLFDVLSTTNFKEIDDVKTICIHHSYNFGSSFNGAIHMMKLLNLIQINFSEIKADESIFLYKRESFFENQLVFEKLFKLLNDENKLEILFNLKTTKQNSETQEYFIKGNQIPFSLNHIKKFLINTGFLELIENTHNTYLVNSNFKDFFTSFIIDGFKKKSKKRKISLSKLKEIQELQRKLGYEAECFVLNFELNKLSKHLSKNNIKIISEEYSNAGYDIESFDSENSIVNDKFIEVKSYSENLSFYWSRNEIETAKQLGDCYFIYLVDRKKMNLYGYKPIEIQNPFETILENNAWGKTIENYKIEFKANFNSSKCLKPNIPNYL